MTDSAASPDPAIPLAAVRYRAGEVGETRRVVHTAVLLPNGIFFAMCGEEIGRERAEITSSGMPCVACVRKLALRARHQAPALSGQEVAP